MTFKTDRWSSHIWLVWLLWFTNTAIIQSGPAWHWIANGLGLAVFFPLYFAGHRREGAAVIPVIGGLFVLGMALLPINTGAGVLFIYAISFLGRAARPAVAGLWLAALVLLTAGYVLLFRLSPFYVEFGIPPELIASVPAFSLIPLLSLMVLVGIATISGAEMDRKNQQLRRSHEEIEQLAKLTERERIGRDLHDLLGHTLSVIVLKSELAAKLAERDPQRSVDEIRDVERISREALSDVRAAITGYRAQGLSGELDRARLALEAGGITVSPEMDPVTLTAAQESALSLALRECVTNVVRHAQATRCTVRLRQEGDRIRLDVEDDGIGGELTDGGGLAGMRARVGAIGGAVEHDGRAGWRLAISIPVDVRSPSRPGMAAAIRTTAS